MGRTAVTCQPRVICNNTNREILITQIRADLFQIPHTHKRHHTDNKRNASFQCQTGRNSHYTLLCNSRIDKSARISCLKICTPPANIRCQKPDTVICFCQFCNRISNYRPPRIEFFQCIRFLHNYPSISRASPASRSASARFKSS